MLCVVFAVLSEVFCFFLKLKAIQCLRYLVVEAELLELCLADNKAAENRCF